MNRQLSRPIALVQLLFMLLALVSCSQGHDGKEGLSPVSTPAHGDMIIVENEGRVCFQRYNNLWIKVVVSPKGCYSSTPECTKILEKLGEVHIDDNSSIIQVRSRFVINDTSAHQTCDRDCGGAGTIVFDMGALSEKIYAVRIGDATLGSFNMPADIISLPDEQRVCVGQR